MDIQKWLEATADRVSVNGSDVVDVPGFAKLGPKDAQRIGQLYRHKRKHASSDGSFLEPRLVKNRNTKARQHSPPLGHSQKTGIEEVSQSNSKSVSSRSIRHKVPQKTYERRARHKTRPDLYEPKVKKQRQEHDAQKESKTKQKRRKSHRSGEGHRTTRLVQSFQLKNGPKNNRLTVSLLTSIVVEMLLSDTPPAQAGRKCWTVQAWSCIGADGRPRRWLSVYHHMPEFSRLTCR